MSRVVPKFFQVRAPATEKPKPTKLRASITAGTVLILLAGRYAGKRVVFLKQLASGLLLVSGPFTLNKVPFLRVNQCHVIATSTKIDISGLQVPATLDDSYFSNSSAKKNIDEATKKERKALQESVDAELMKCIEKVPMMKEYLHGRFSLRSRSVRVHDMTF